MGNGAAVAGGPHSVAQGAGGHNFASVEELARSGYFHNHLNEYRLALEEAIKREQIDVLEVLIPAGNTKLTLPLHIAATAGSIESAEILVSAGFGPLITDRDGRTPLHRCAFNHSDESVLCITLLGLQAPKAVNMRDADGCTPLHLAVESINVNAVVAMKEIKGVNTGLLNGKGQTCRDIANKKNLKDILDVLDGKSSKGGGAGAGGKGPVKSSASQVDPERIMKVWEAFFEHAMKNMEAESAVGGMMVDTRGLHHATSKVKSDYQSFRRDFQQNNSWGDAEDDYDRKDRYNKKTRNRRSSSSDEDENDLVYGKKRSPSQTRNTKGKAKAKAKEESKESPSKQTEVKKQSAQDEYTTNGVIAWFQYVCCLDSYTNCLYVINVCDTSASTDWLDDHIYAQQYWYNLVPILWNDDLDSYYSLPTDCAAAVRCGWITYYDDTSNECCWYNIPSRHSVSCLPLGLDEFCDSEWGKSLGLAEYENSREWRIPPHSLHVRYSWIAVVIYDDNGGDQGQAAANVNNTNANVKRAGTLVADSSSGSDPSYYFLNQVTGVSSWYPPDGWDTLVHERWGGWILCMSESSNWDMFWWDPASGESVWVESTIESWG